MFYYLTGETHASFQDDNFTPTFVSDATLLASTAGMAVCGDNLQCLYDFMATGDADFARNTRDEVVEFRELAEMFAEGMFKGTN